MRAHKPTSPPDLTENEVEPRRVARDLGVLALLAIAFGLVDWWRSQHPIRGLAAATLAVSELSLLLYFAGVLFRTAAWGRPRERVRTLDLFRSSWTGDLGERLDLANDAGTLSLHFQPAPEDCRTPPNRRSDPREVAGKELLERRSKSRLQGKERFEARHALVAFVTGDLHSVPGAQEVRQSLLGEPGALAVRS